MLELSRTGAKAVDPTARTWSSGRVTELEDAIKLIDKVLLAEASARIKARTKSSWGRQELSGKNKGVPYPRDLVAIENVCYHSYSLPS